MEAAADWAFSSTGDWNKENEQQVPNFWAPVLDALMSSGWNTISEQLMQDLNGVFNINDDIIGHGRDTKEHDRKLEAFLKKIWKKNVIFNNAKCEFNKTRVVYYGLKFSKDRVSPDPNKVQAIKMECNRT